MVARTCTRCGVVDTDADPTSLPLGWSLASNARGVEAMCTSCTREHTRDIEAKLDETWWA